MPTDYYLSVYPVLPERMSSSRNSLKFKGILVMIEGEADPIKYRKFECEEYSSYTCRYNLAKQLCEDLATAVRYSRDSTWSNLPESIVPIVEEYLANRREELSRLESLLLTKE